MDFRRGICGSKTCHESFLFRLHIAIGDVKSQNIFLCDTETRCRKRLFIHAKISEAFVVGVGILAVCNSDESDRDTKFSLCGKKATRRETFIVRMRRKEQDRSGLGVEWKKTGEYRQPILFCVQGNNHKVWDADLPVSVLRRRRFASQDNPEISTRNRYL